jgi:PncC family amidohydrolase
MDRLDRDPGAEAAAGIHATLLSRQQTVASAESLTGGALGELLSAAPGASESYVGGVVAYATEIKRRVLGVSAETVERHGVVSAECAAEMAAGVRGLMRSAYGVSTTGVAGPTEQEGKPVGLVFVGVAGPEGTVTEEHRLNGDRPEIRREAVLAALSALRAQLVDPAAG